MDVAGVIILAEHPIEDRSAAEWDLRAQCPVFRNVRNVRKRFRRYRMFANVEVSWLGEQCYQKTRANIILLPAP